MDIFINYFPMLATTIELLLQFYFFTKFIGRRAGICGYLLFAGLNAVYLQINAIPVFFKLTLCIAALSCYGCILCRKSSKTVILYALITVEVMALCYSISNSFLMLLSGLYSFSPSFMGCMFMLTGSGTAFVLAVLCYQCVYKYFTGLNIKENQYVLISLTPLLLIFIANQYMENIIFGDSVSIVKGGGIFDTAYFPILIIQIFAITSLFCIIYSYIKLAKSFQLSERLSLLEQEVSYQSQYVQEAKERYEKTRSVRHDLKSHLSIIYGLLSKRDTEQARKYLRNIEDLSDELSFSCHTNHPVLDILIANKLGIAQNKGIEVSCSAEFPYPCLIEDIDLCIVLSNALDNAIHACEKTTAKNPKYIRISGKRQGDLFLIAIENSYDGIKSIQKGIGLSNIEAVAEKYNGAMNISILQDSFILSVLLIIPQQQTGI